MNQKLSATIEFELVRTETLNEFKQSADFRGLGIERAYTNLFGPQFSPPTELTSSTMNNNQLNHPVQQPVNLKKNINSTDLPSMKPPNPQTATEHCSTLGSFIMSIQLKIRSRRQRKSLFRCQTGQQN